MAGLFLHRRFSDTLISPTHCDNLFKKRDDKVFVRLRHWRKLVSFFVKDTFNKLGYKAKINTHTTSYIN